MPLEDTLCREEGRSHNLFGVRINHFYSILCSVVRSMDEDTRKLKRKCKKAFVERQQTKQRIIRFRRRTYMSKTINSESKRGLAVWNTVLVRFDAAPEPVQVILA